MSFFPTSAVAAAALDILRGGRTDPIAAPIDRADLRQLLIAYHCPIVCDGIVRGERWHETCEAAADRALAEVERGMFLAFAASASTEPDAHEGSTAMADTETRTAGDVRDGDTIVSLRTGNRCLIVEATPSIDVNGYVTFRTEFGSSMSFPRGQRVDVLIA